MIYVDDARIPARVGRFNAHWSHLTADTRDELHTFAQSLGLRRAWFQDKGDGRWHYDVTESRRQAAIAAGAKPIGFREMVEVIGQRRVLEARSGVPGSGQWVILNGHRRDCAYIRSVRDDVPDECDCSDSDDESEAADV